MRRSGRAVTILLSSVVCVMAVVLAVGGTAYGFGSYLTEFNTTYGTSGTRLDTCGLCHVNPSGGGTVNPYGSDFANASIGNHTFNATLDGTDSDGDTFTNIDEINALTFPGDATDFPTAAEPQIGVTPVSFDYGSVTVGSSASQVFTVSNTGTADLVISDGILSDETNFTLDPNVGTTPCGDVPITITPSGTCTVSIAFNPLSTGPFNAVVTVTSNDPNSPHVIDLAGTGVSTPTSDIQVSPASVDFGVVNVGDTPATEVTITNAGTDNLVVTNIALDNTDVFSLEPAGGTNPCGSTSPTISPGGNCTLEVVFTPVEDGGPFTATMTIASSAPNVDVPITGNGFLDSDGDGVGDSVDNFPNDPSKATPEAATGTGKILVDATPDTLSGVAAVALAPGQSVSGYTFPDGLVTFQVTVAAPGDNAVVTLTFPSGQPSNGKYYKDDGSGTLVEFTGATVNTDNVVLMLTDGGSGDNDNTADGVINDPGGLATPVSSSGGGGGGGCSVTGRGGDGYGGTAVLFLTLLVVLVALRRQGARARR